jgi:hypothetical protein
VIMWRWLRQQKQVQQSEARGSTVRVWRSNVGGTSRSSLTLCKHLSFLRPRPKLLDETNRAIDRKYVCIFCGAWHRKGRPQTERWPSSSGVRRMQTKPRTSKIIRVSQDHRPLYKVQTEEQMRSRLSQEAVLTIQTIYCMEEERKPLALALSS